MDEVEFESNMESAKLLLSGLSKNLETSQTQIDQNFVQVTSSEPTEQKPASITRKHQHPSRHPQSVVESSETVSRNEELNDKDQNSLNKATSISDIENEGAMMLLKEQEASQNFREFPYLYSQAGDLTVGEVEDLLTNYKQLVFKYVCLAKGLGVSVPTNSLSSTQDKLEADPNEGMQKELSTEEDNSGEKSDSGLDNSEQ